jgi:hypothetical protein
VVVSPDALLVERKESNGGMIKTEPRFVNGLSNSLNTFLRGKLLIQSS